MLEKLFLKNYAENEVGASSGSLFAFWKGFIWGKSKWSAL